MDFTTATFGRFFYEDMKMKTNLNHRHVEAQFHQLGQQHRLPPHVVNDFLTLHHTHTQRRRNRDQEIIQMWRDQTQRDPVLQQKGGLDANIAKAQQLLHRFGDSHLQQSLQTTGMGNHPALIRLLVRLAHHLDSAGRPVPPDRQQMAKRQEDALRDLYPTMYKTNS